MAVDFLHQLKYYRLQTMFQVYNFYLIKVWSIYGHLKDNKEINNEWLRSERNQINNNMKLNTLLLTKLWLLKV